MPAEWGIRYWPDCDMHAFLSHCAEDRQALILPVYQELSRRAVFPWADWHHYPAGRESFETLREELLRARHIVYFITPAMLTQARGWANAERAFGATIQQQLRYRDVEVAHVELHLLFVPQGHHVLQRSAWRSLAGRCRQCPHAAPRTCRQRLLADNGHRSWKAEHVQWAADAIEKFVRNEDQWAVDLNVRLSQDSRLQAWLDATVTQDENLKRRLLGLTPVPLPDRLP